MSERSHESRGVGATAAPGGTSDAQSVTPTPPSWTRWPADGVITYQLVGPIDYAAAFGLYRHALEDLLASERTFVLDFTAAADIDTRALDVFKNLSQRILEVHGRLTFEHVSAEIEAV